MTDRPLTDTQLDAIERWLAAVDRGSRNPAPTIEDLPDWARQEAA